MMAGMIICMDIHPHSLNARSAVPIAIANAAAVMPKMSAIVFLPAPARIAFSVAGMPSAVIASAISSMAVMMKSVRLMIAAPLFVSPPIVAVALPVIHFGVSSSPVS